MSETNLAHLRYKMQQIANRAPVYRRRPEEFQFNNQLALDDVQELESQWEIKLPEQYTRFLTEVGDGGAGVLRLVDSICEYQNLAKLLARPEMRGCSLKGTFPLNDIDAMRVALLGRPLQHAFPVDGMLPLCFCDDSWVEVLAISGEQQGRMWAANVMPEGKTLWHINSETDPPGFLEWLENWLDRRLVPFVAGTGQDSGESKRLCKATFSAYGHRNSVSSHGLLLIARHLPNGVTLLLDAVDSMLNTPLDRQEVYKLLDDMQRDSLRDVPYILYEGAKGEIFVRYDAWGREVILEVRDTGTCFVTVDRSTLHERMEDLFHAFAEAYLVAMHEDIDHDLLFRVSTASLLKKSQSSA